MNVEENINSNDIKSENTLQPDSKQNFNNYTSKNTSKSQTSISSFEHLLKDAKQLYRDKKYLNALTLCLKISQQNLLNLNQSKRKELKSKIFLLRKKCLEMNLHNDLNALQKLDSQYFDNKSLLNSNFNTLNPNSSATYNLNIVTDDIEISLNFENSVDTAQIFEIPRKTFKSLFQQQRVSLAWLQRLYIERNGGILADDMGLGKTIQIAVFLKGLFNSRLISNVLFVTEASILESLRNELMKWCKGIPIEVLISQQSNEKRELVITNIRENGGILLLSYGMLYYCRDILRSRKIEESNNFCDYMNLWNSSSHIIENECLYNDDLECNTKDLNESSCIYSDFIQDYMVLDEGHKIKNPKSKVFKAARSIKVRDKHRIILTGTPLQNRIDEIQALFDFLFEGHLLNDFTAFKLQYCERIQKANEKCASDKQKNVGAERAQQLRQLLSPYILRRTKQQCLNNSPSKEISDDKHINNVFHENSISQNTKKRKIEDKEVLSSSLINLETVKKDTPFLEAKNDFIVQIRLNTIQKSMYNELLKTIKSMINLNLFKAGSGSFVALSILKKICDSPNLLKPQLKLCQNLDFSKVWLENQMSKIESNESLLEVDISYIMSISPKLLVSYKLLKSLCDDEHKILFFSQSLLIIKIIKTFIETGDDSKMKCLSLTGQIKQNARYNIVQQFQNDPSLKILLLTSHVGSLGLNLVAADRVIIFDPSQNPARDMQAVDRVYRIGQHRSVVIFRLMTCGTIEEKIYRRQISKIGLNNILGLSFKAKSKKEVDGDVEYDIGYGIGQFTHSELYEVFEPGNFEKSETFETYFEQRARINNSRDYSDETLEDLKILYALDDYIAGISDHKLLSSINFNTSSKSKNYHKDNDAKKKCNDLNLNEQDKKVETQTDEIRINQNKNCLSSSKFLYPLLERQHHETLKPTTLDFDTDKNECCGDQSIIEPGAKFHKDLLSVSNIQR